MSLTAGERKSVGQKPISSLSSVSAAPVYRCNFEARAVYTSKGLRHVQELTVVVSRISTHMIEISYGLSGLLPDCFTLVLGARQHGMGCVTYYRTESALHCHLIRPESPVLIDYLTKVRDPGATIRPILHPLFQRARVL